MLYILLNTNKNVFKLGKSELAVLTDLLTPHCPSWYHLKKIHITETDICWFYEYETETVVWSMSYDPEWIIPEVLKMAPAEETLKFTLNTEIYW